MASNPSPLMTAEEYLDIESHAVCKSEFIDGQMFAMSGVDRSHNVIAWNIGSELHMRLKGTPCHAHTSDMRVAVSVRDTYVYPDVSIVCKDARYIRRGTDNLLNPIAIFEILSPSTEALDRGKKFARYKGLESLQEYILVAQNKVLVEHFVRQADGDWPCSQLTTLDDSLHLVSVAAVLPLRDIYGRVFAAGE